LGLGRRIWQEVKRKSFILVNFPKHYSGDQMVEDLVGGGALAARIAEKRSARSILVAKHEKTGNSEDLGIDRKTY
jgi:hypothetical protein